MSTPGSLLKGVQHTIYVIEIFLKSSFFKCSVNQLTYTVFSERSRAQTWENLVAICPHQPDTKIDSLKSPFLHVFHILYSSLVLMLHPRKEMSVHADLKMFILLCVFHEIWSAISRANSYYYKIIAVLLSCR